ncbi:hypothetical protein K1T71_014341 [Dendrolimus kikuchii]|uniref:Uncharacterized protein n=1 Tax=Dendrolimus kikuchii TaxID=765133 RepID=A0ACC1CE10_9NEOP|nr:hypothetical protein K1T71_014341 [Dendrolimus kikuchii]
MEDEYIEIPDGPMEVNRVDGDGSIKDFGLEGQYEEVYEEDDGSNGFRGNRGRGNFRARGRGPPPGWMNGPPMRFRGRGYGPGGPPMRGRGFFRGRGGPGPRGFGPNGGPGFDGNWGPMGPPPPGMMGGPPPFGPPPGMMPPGGPMGPPPNMMGQPPPYGGPPNMPPPSMPTPELWVETKSEDGKSYYYHARSRETTWTRPQEGPTCKVITQADMEVMAATGQVPGMGGQTMPMGGPMGGPPMGGPPMGGPPMGGPPMGGPPMGMMPGMVPPMGQPHPMTNVPPFMNQPPPWHKDGMKDKMEDDQMDNDEMPPGETTPVSQPNNNMMGYPPSSNGGPPNFALGYPPGVAGGPGGPGPAGPGGPGGPGPGGPGGPPGWGGAWGGWPPPLVGQPPPNMAAANVPDAGGAAALSQMGVGGAAASQPPPSIVATIHLDSPSQATPKEETVIPPELVALAAQWTAHRAPDGRPYYYNASKQESVWKKPEPMKELEELQAKVALERGEKKPEVEAKIDIVDVDAYEEAQAAAEAERRAAAERERERERLERERQEREKQEKERQEKERLEKEKQEKEAAEKEKAKQDKRLPLVTAPIAGTPWCVVWTGDRRVFFHNPTTLSSVWSRPAQLLGRADVDAAIANPPQVLLELQDKEAAAAAATATNESGGVAKANGEVAVKRTAADSDKDDSDAEPPKKAKPDDGKAAGGPGGPGAGEIGLGKEAATEAEVRAARQRAVVPHEQRLRSFLAMLHEKDVSAFSTWEKELHKIVFDPRYLMLNTKDRRQVFDQYVRERAEEERKEKKNRLQQKKLAFKQLMEEAKLHSKSSYTEFASKHSRDERFKGIEKARVREMYFNEHLGEVRKREKEEKDKKREQVKMEFIQLLKEKTIDRHSRWIDVKKKVDSEARYKAVENSTLREDYFREYCKIIKEERKKEKDAKEKDREGRSKKDKKDKDRDKDKESKKEKKKEKAAEKKEAPAAAEDAGAAEGGGGEAAGAQDDEAAERERRARAQASIKEREKEVQRALATSLRDRDKEREYHKRDEAVQHFNALLADLVRNPDLSWRDAKKQLKKDHRYSLAELLSKEDKERLFVQHTGALGAKRRDKLRALLNELGVSCTAHWRDVRDSLKAEPTAPQYSSASQMEREFRDYQRDKQSAAKTALRQLLLETRAITHKTLAAVKDNPNAMAQLQETLKHDARYLALDHIHEERQSMIMSYLEEMEKKGPPPPPTATEPTRRSKQ